MERREVRFAPLDPADPDALGRFLWRCRLLHHLRYRLYCLTPHAGKE